MQHPLWQVDGLFIWILTPGQRKTSSNLLKAVQGPSQTLWGANTLQPLWEVGEWKTLFKQYLTESRQSFRSCECLTIVDVVFLKKPTGIPVTALCPFQKSTGRLMISASVNLYPISFSEPWWFPRKCLKLSSPCWICLLLPRLVRESSPPKLTFSACYGALLVAILWGFKVRFISTKHCFIHLLHRNCKPLLPGRILWQGGRLCWAATSMSAPAPEGKLGGSWHCLAVG